MDLLSELLDPAMPEIYPWRLWLSHPIDYLCLIKALKVEVTCEKEF